MEQESLPIIELPYTWIIVDDNRDFLDNFSFVLGKDFKYKIFLSAKEALKYVLAQDAALKEFEKKYFSITTDDDEVAKPAINLDIPNLHKIIYDNSRFSMSTVMITDYAMPDMDGMDLCERTQNTRINRIMLTGEAGYDLAVKGFNKGYINQFLLKDDVDLYDKIKQYGLYWQKQAFIKMSRSFIDALSGGKESIFTDPVFIGFFNDAIKRLHIIEYYLLDDSGSYLMLNAQGKVYWLIVKSEEDMRELYELADDDTDVPFVVIDGLKKRKKIAYFPTEKHKLISASRWPLEDAYTMEGKHNFYYYTIVEGTDEYYRLNTREILPYQTYLET